MRVLASNSAHVDRCAVRGRPVLCLGPLACLDSGAARLTHADPNGSLTVPSSSALGADRPCCGRGRRGPFARSASRVGSRCRGSRRRLVSRLEAVARMASYKLELSNAQSNTDARGISGTAWSGPRRQGCPDAHGWSGAWKSFACVRCTTGRIRELCRSGCSRGYLGVFP